MQKHEKCFFIGIYYFMNADATWKSLSEPAEDMQPVHPSQKPDMDKAIQAQSVLHIVHKLIVVAWMNPDKIEWLQWASPNCLPTESGGNKLCLMCLLHSNTWLIQMA